MDFLFQERIRALSRPLERIPSGEEPVLVDMKGVRTVIFDVYGTCFISGSGDIGTTAASPRQEALTESLREQGVEVDDALTVESMERFYELIRLDHRRSRAEGIEYPEVRILDIWEQWRREAMVQVDVRRLAIDVECRLNPVWPMPGLETTLDGLRGAGLDLGIVSNAQAFTPQLFPALTGRALEAFGIPPAHCVWSWVGREAKPSQHLYLRVLERLGAPDPATCLYVGNDMRNDIAPARAVGMQTALFAGDARSLRWREGDPLVEGVLPDMVITRLAQLLECV